MAGFSPLKITGFSAGLINERENFLLPDDGFPTLQNAYVWRERILRKQGYQLLGRLQRNIIVQPAGTTSASVWSFNLYSQLTIPITPESNATIAPGSVVIDLAPSTITGNIVPGPFSPQRFATGYTNATDCEVFSNTLNGLRTNDFVTISGVVVKPGSGPNLINGGPYEIEIIPANTSFKLNLDSTGWGEWQSGGVWTSGEAGTIQFVDNGNGILTSTTFGNSGTINYTNGNVTLSHTAGAGIAVDLTFSYYPNLPVMGIRTRELQNSANDQTIFFDQKYAYVFNASFNSFNEFIPGTTWNAHGANADTQATDFFWSTNYWVSSTVIPGTETPFFTTSNIKLFWETNNTGQFGALADPPRITDGITWVDFDSSTWNQIDATNYLWNFLSMLPFRGRMVTFNTWEGTTKAGAANYSNRIRWSTIGNPFIPFSAGPPAKGSWRSDIRGQGGFLDIPTSEDIVSIGFVRDNLVIYCERSTWQLRYTGRSIAPFQIERVNSENGSQSPFASVQFDTSLVTIGDKGILECDSYKAELIDIKIPDLVFKFQSTNNAVVRVQGIRDFINRLAFWTITQASANSVFPTQRLLYNYENDSWALFNDSLTALGTYQPQSSRTWLNTHIPWIECNFPWIDNMPASVPAIVGGNQQGFIEYLDQLTVNDVSLYISAVTGNGIAGTPITGTPTVITSPNHNMATGFVIGISGIPSATGYANLNGGIFGIIVLNANTFQLMKYNASEDQFSTPQLDLPDTYVGGGLINIRENFTITSKKFNFLDEGQSIQLGYIDVLTAATGKDNPGAFSLNVYLNYDDSNVSNTLPENEINGVSPPTADDFFNTIIPTVPSSFAVASEGTKFWQRVFCPTRANFVTIQYTFSNAQMASIQQQLPIQIDAQVLWIRKSGRLTQL